MKVIVFMFAIAWLEAFCLSDAIKHSSSNNKLPYPRYKRFKDVLAEAKKTAIDAYLERAMTNTRQTGREKSLLNKEEELEMVMYVRKLETLLRKRCYDFWCINDHATGTTPSTTTTSDEPTSTTPTTTPTSTTTTTTTTPAPVIQIPNWNIYLPAWPPDSWSGGVWKRKRRLGGRKHSQY